MLGIIRWFAKYATLETIFTHCFVFRYYFHSFTYTNTHIYKYGPPDDTYCFTSPIAGGCIYTWPQIVLYSVSNTHIFIHMHTSTVNTVRKQSTLKHITQDLVICLVQFFGSNFLTFFLSGFNGSLITRMVSHMTYTQCHSGAPHHHRLYIKRE